MAEFVAGTTTVLTWVWSGGTQTFAADFRTYTFTPSGDTVDASAGADTAKVRLPTLKDSQASVTMVNPTSATGGTAYASAFAVNNLGTLTIQPEGTATNMRKITMPAYCQGFVSTFPYNDVVTATVNFIGNGAYTDGVN